MFDKKIYLEGLRQATMYGIYMTITILILNNLFPIVTLITENIQNSQQSYYQTYNGGERVSLLLLNFVVTIFSVIMPFFMSMVQFDFINKRKSCDFFHAIPVKRNVLFFNFSLASFTWIFISLTIPTILNLILFNYSSIFYIKMSTVITDYVSIIVVAVYIYSVSSLAMFLTGKKFTTMLLTAIILFLPNFLYCIINFSIDVTVPNFLYSYFDLSEALRNGFIMKYNLLMNFASTFLSFMYVSNYDVDFNLTLSILYTAGLAIISYFIAMYLFDKRKSEMAEKNSSSDIMQTIFRFLITIPFTAIIVTIIFYIYISGADFTYYIAVLIVLLAIMLVAYFSYELLSTKSFANIKKSVPKLIFTFAFSILYLITLFGSREYVLNKTIEPSNVKSISINDAIFNVDQLTSYYILNEKYEDEQMIKMLCDSLKHTVDVINSPSYTYDRTTEHLQVTFNTNTGSVSRNLHVDGDVITYISDFILSSEEIKKITTTLPLKSDIKYGRVSYSGDFFETKDDFENFLDVFYDEFNSLSDEQKIMSASENIMSTIIVTDQVVTTPQVVEYNNYVNNKKNTTLVLNLYVYEDNAAFALNKSIYLNDNFPKTKEHIANILSQSRKFNNRKISLLKEIESENISALYDLSITGFHDTIDIKYFSHYDENENKLSLEFVTEIKEILKSALSRENDASNLYMLNVNFNFGGGYNIPVTFTEEEILKLTDILNNAA